ncbi:DUF616 domain-containing protein [bacterium]|nr:DUF616 domain-containing protein [bacterium]
MRIAVYTCITDAYDPLYSPAYVDQRLDYFCFSESPSNVVGPWKFKRIDLQYLNAKDQNRYIKMHPHKVLPEYDVTLYIDGSIRIVGDVHEMVTKALQLEGDIFLYDHHERNCIYSEAAACAHCSHDWIWTIARQMRRYSREGYPVNNGLYEAGVILRRNTDRVSKIMEYWWIEYSQGAKRDQLSLTYVCWKLGVSISSMGKSDHRFTHHYLRFVNHPQRRRLLFLISKYSKYIINRSVVAIVPYNRLFSIKQLVDE